MDEKFQAIFEGKEPEDGMPAINIPIRAEEAFPTEPIQEPEPEEPYPEEKPAENPEFTDSEPSQPEEDDNDPQRLWECFAELNTANESANAKLSAMMAQLEAINREMSRLAAYDKAVDTLNISLAANRNTEAKLYKEVEEYKKDTYFTNIKPFLMFMTDMLCEMKKSLSQYLEDKEEFIAENGENAFREITELLGFFIGSFENQLKIQGVEILTFEPDSNYTAGQQRISKTVRTDDPGKNGKIAAVLSDCYMYGNTVLRPAKVTAYKYNQN